MNFLRYLDVELLEACREEFHRRLKVYHAWKSKNRKGKNPSATGDQNDENDEERAPQDILNNGKLNHFSFSSTESFDIIHTFSHATNIIAICSQISWNNEQYENFIEQQNNW